MSIHRILRRRPLSHRRRIRRRPPTPANNPTLKEKPMKAKDALILAKEHLAADRLQEAGRLFAALVGVPVFAAEANAGLGYVALKANAPQQAATYFERALAGDLS